MYNVMKNELKQEAKERIIEALENGYDGYLCDLHNEVFNTDYEYTYTSDAKKCLNCMMYLKQLEKYRIMNSLILDL